MQVNIYNKQNLQELDWESHEEGKALQSLLEPLILQGTQHFISNVDNEVQVLSFGKSLLPLVIGNPKAKRNSYLTSTLTQYFDLALEEIEMEMKGKGSFYAFIAPFFLAIFRSFFKLLGFEKVVFVNNFILSTNLYPNLAPSGLKNIKDKLSQAFPGHAIVFRSVDQSLDKAIHEELKTLRFREIISRPILYMDPQEHHYQKKRMFKMDQKLWKKNKKYHWELLHQSDESSLQRICQLYEDLYLKKYSSLNPAYRIGYIRLLLDSNLLDFWVLMKDKEIYGVSAFFKRQGKITTPFIGYEMSVPLKEGLYRFLNYHLMQTAIDENLVLNMSSGAAHFKKLRGGQPSLEYNMVYDRHLPFWQRIPWHIYHFVSEKVAIPSIQKYEL